MVVVEGEAGVGKSTLVSQLFSLAKDLGVRVVDGAAGLPYVRALALAERGRCEAGRPAEQAASYRAAHELFDGAYVNLGIGIPTLVSDYVPAGAYFRAILRNSAQLF